MAVGRGIQGQGSVTAPCHCCYRRWLLVCGMSGEVSHFFWDVVSDKKRRIEDLETRLQIGEGQYNAVVNELNALRARFESLGAGDVLQIQDALNQLQAQYQQQQMYLGQLSEAVSARQYELNQIESQIGAAKYELGNLGFQLQDVTGLFESGLTEYANPARSSIQLGDELEVIRDRIKEAVRNQTATRATSNFMFNNSTSKG